MFFFKISKSFLSKNDSSTWSVPISIVDDSTRSVLFFTCPDLSALKLACCGPPYYYGKTVFHTTCCVAPCCHKNAFIITLCSCFRFPYFAGNIFLNLDGWMITKRKLPSVCMLHLVVPKNLVSIFFERKAFSTVGWPFEKMYLHVVLFWF